jgi:hypothetical protein
VIMDRSPPKFVVCTTTTVSASGIWVVSSPSEFVRVVAGC